MLEGYNWLDLIIFIIVAAAVIKGIRAGLIRSVFNVAGLVIGFLAAVSYYAPAGSMILRHINLPQIIADVLSFIVIFAVTTAAVHLVGSLVAVLTKIRLFRFADRVGGSAAGLLIGFILVGIILIMITAFPLFNGFHDQVEESYLAPTIVENTQQAYEELGKLLPVELPQLTSFPEELSSYLSVISTRSEHSDHHRVNFKELEGATCFVCGGPVEFIGYLDNNMQSVSPKFICTECDRTSDGCQTYEGYHEMYQVCPVELGKLGYRFDCGVWTNHSYHRPTGPCAVCGAE